MFVFVVSVVVGVFLAVCSVRIVISVIDGIFVDVVVLTRQAGTYIKSLRPCTHIFLPGTLSGTTAYTRTSCI